MNLDSYEKKHAGLSALITTEQAAKYLGFSKRTLEYWRVKGIGPNYKRIGKKRVRYEVAVLDAWLTDCERGGLQSQTTSSESQKTD